MCAKLEGLDRIVGVQIGFLGNDGHESEVGAGETWVDAYRMS